MDGYHLSNEVLRTLGREGRKGAIDTFDAEGFAVLLERLRARTGETVYAPHFDHGVGEPIAASVAIPASVDIVLVDGNYLLADGPEWERARAVMDEVWYLETPHDIRLERLIARHVATGKSPEMAIAWANGSDQDNARLIAATAARAQLIVEG
jgi:pantothenate kinase